MKTDHQTLKIEKRGRALTISLNRPDVRNAFHPTMIGELTEAFKGASAQMDLSVVILRGEGKSFCSGADLGYMQSMAGFSFEENKADSNKLFGMFQALRDCPHPVIGRVHGHVMGGALGLLAQCDLAAGVDGTQFCFSEVRLGLAPAVISPFVLEKMLPHEARRYMLTAEVFDTAVAKASGLLNFVGSETEVDRFVESVSKTLSHNGPEGVRATKALIRSFGEIPDWNRRQELTTTVISERRVSGEGQEGLKAFLEKRTPSWKPAD
jgi:methylglutaconyl-CoA hydratase